MTSYRREFAGPSVCTTNTVSCVAHYKDDIDKPWVSMEGMNFSLRLHPKSTMTLEDLAKLIEDFLNSLFASNNSSLQLPATQQLRVVQKVDVKVQVCLIKSLVFRGESMARAQFATLQAVDYLRDQEPFNVVYEVTSSFVGTRTVSGVFCCCFGRGHGQDRAGS